MAEPLDVKKTWMIYLPLPAGIRSRLPPMVSLPHAEARATKRRYEASPQGKAAKRRYEASPKGKATLALRTARRASAGVAE